MPDARQRAEEALAMAAESGLREDAVTKALRAAVRGADEGGNDGR